MHKWRHIVTQPIISELWLVSRSFNLPSRTTSAISGRFRAKIIISTFNSFGINFKVKVIKTRENTSRQFSPAEFFSEQQKQRRQLQFAPELFRSQRNVIFTTTRVRKVPLPPPPPLLRPTIFFFSGKLSRQPASIHSFQRRHFWGFFKIKIQI